MTRKLKKAADPEFPPIHVLITGDREWDDDYIVTILVAGLKLYHGLNIHVWHGAAPGADTLAMLAVNEVSGIQLHPYPADWERYGKSAGPRRNTQMLNAMLSKAATSPASVTMGIAFKDDIRTDSGTRNMVRQLLRKDVPVYVISRPMLDELRG